MSGLPDDKLFAEFHPNPPAGADAIKRCEAELGFPLPIEYSEFLRTMNGGEGFLGENAYLVLWRVEELMEMNSGYKLPEDPPDERLLIGSNGAGEAFAFDMRRTPHRLIAIPFIGLEWREAILIATNFRDFLETLFKTGIPFLTGAKFGPTGGPCS